MLAYSGLDGVEWGVELFICLWIFFGSVKFDEVELFICADDAGGSGGG